MRVVCIDTNLEGSVKVPPLKVGRIYNVIDEYNSKGNFLFEKRVIDGIYYRLIENNAWYHNSLFVPIDEVEIDETECQNKNLLKQLK